MHASLCGLPSHVTGSLALRQVHVQNVECDIPVHLPFITLRAVQNHFTQKAKISKLDRLAKFVYFSEMDNVLHIRDPSIFDMVRRHL